MIKIDIKTPEINILDPKIPTDTLMRSFEQSIEKIIKKHEMMDAYNLSVSNQIEASIEQLINTINSIYKNIPEQVISQTASLLQTLDRYSEQIAQIDWESIELTDEDIEQARKTLEENKAEEKIHEGFSENKDPSKIKKSVKVIIKVVYHTVIFLSALVSVFEYVEDRVIPVVQSYQAQKDMFQSEKAGIKWLNDELNKKDVSEQIIKKFRIVSKNGLPVYELKTKNSRTTGVLNVGYVVQISQKDRNWSYVIYTDHETGEYIEGWVFTRYLKQIK